MGLPDYDHCSDLPQEDRDEESLSNQRVQGEPLDRCVNPHVEANNLHQVKIRDLEEAVPPKIDDPNAEHKDFKVFSESGEISNSHGQLRQQQGWPSSVHSGYEVRHP